jgi:hypothetical protein
VKAAAPSCFLTSNQKRDVVAALNFSEKEADKFIRRAIAALDLDAYHDQEVMSYATADVYAFKSEGEWWYLKLYLEEGELRVTSCHEPHREMERRDGKVARPWKKP